MARSTDPFRYFGTSLEVIRLVVMMYVKHPLSLRNVEDLLFERGIDICHEALRGDTDARPLRLAFVRQADLLSFCFGSNFTVGSGPTSGRWHPVPGS